MDLSGLVRRYMGAAGVILAAFGIWDQAEATSAVDQALVAIGSVMYLIDLGKSTLAKIRAKFGG